MSKPEKIRILTFDPPYRLNQAEALSTLTRETGKSQNLRNTSRSMAENCTRARHGCFLEIWVSNF